MTSEQVRPHPRCERCGADMRLRTTGAVGSGGAGPSQRLRLHYVCPACGHESDLFQRR